MTDDEISTGNIIIVALEQLILKDKTLNEVFDLEYGEEAERKFLGDKWVRDILEYDDDEE